MVAEQLCGAVHTNDLLCHWAVENNLQELVTANRFGFFNHEARRTSCNNVHVADQVRVFAVAQVVLVQALDGWCDDVLVDVADNLLDTLASVGDQHRQAR